MTADLLREAASGIRDEWSGGPSPRGTAWHRERDFHLAVADWLDVVRLDHELDDEGRVVRFCSSIDEQDRALAVARAYLGRDA